MVYRPTNESSSIACSEGGKTNQDTEEIKPLNFKQNNNNPPFWPIVGCFSWAITAMTTRGTTKLQKKEIEMPKMS